MLSPEVATLSPHEGPTTEDGFPVAELLPEPIFRGNCGGAGGLVLLHWLGGGGESS
jgi:hypothetical protein